MIRFIDLGKQIAVDESDPEYPRQFCFFNTIDDQFLIYDGEQVWETWEEFDRAWRVHLSFACSQILIQSLNNEYYRLRSLCPAWVFKAEVSQ